MPLPIQSLQVDRGADFLPFLIYLAIFIVWIVSRTFQILTKGKRPGKSDKAARSTPGPVIDDALREFLETVTGTRAVEPRRQPTPPVRPPPIARKPATPQTTRSAPPPKPERPDRKVARPARLARPAPLSPNDIAAGSVMKTEIGAHQDVKIRASKGSLTRLAGLDAMRMPMTGLRLPPMETSRTPRNHLQIIDPDASRRAMIERIVMGPPRALDPNPDDLLR